MYSFSEMVKLVYGTACELCGWDEAMTDAHHIDFYDRPPGWPKNDAVENGCVLCPNCHRMVHTDVISPHTLLTRLPPRKSFNHSILYFLRKVKQ